MNSDLIAKQLAYHKHFGRPFSMTIGGADFPIKSVVQLWVPQEAFEKLDRDPETKRFVTERLVLASSDACFALLADTPGPSGFERRRIIFEARDVNCVHFRENTA